MNKRTKDIVHICIDAVFLSCIIAGGFYAVEWAENVAAGYAAISFVGMLLLTLAVSAAKETGDDKNEDYKKAMSDLYDRKHMWQYGTISTVIESFVMMAAGWFWLGSFYLVALLLAIALRGKAKEFVEKGL